MNFIFENIFLSRDLYQTILTPICTKFELTFAELVVLLFLSKNSDANTAADIVKSRRLTKSAVSMAVRSLEEKGLVKGEFLDGNHRSIHLKICSKANPIVKEGRKAQAEYCNILTDGFSESECKVLKEFFKRISTNVKNFNNQKAVH